MFENPRHLRSRLALVLLGVAASAPLMMAQINTANLSGLVTDPSGAAIPNVTVTVTEPATGYTRTLETDGAGYYSFQDLPTGQYAVKVAGSGFSAESETVTLNLGEKDRRDFKLAVGQETQTVEVQAPAPGLKTDDASIGLVVGEQTIEQTPLYLRNWDDLLRTVPGVQISRYAAEWEHVGGAYGRLQRKWGALAAEQFHSGRDR
jgi:hypothetical protein